MKRNRNILLIVILLIILAAILYFNRLQSSYGDIENDFTMSDTASITKIFLADKANQTILLERESENRWIVNSEYPAGKEVMNLFLETLYRVTPRAPVPNSAHDEVIRQLATSSVKIEIYKVVYRINIFDKIKLFPLEKAVRIYYVGGPTPNNMGTFMVAEGNETPYVLHILGFRGYVSTRYSTMLKDWRSHEVFRHKISDIKAISFEMPDLPDESFEVRKNGEDYSVYTLKDNKELPGYDTLKLFNFVTAFYDLRFEALKNNNPRRDSVINSTPAYIITLTDVNDVATTMKGYRKPNDDNTFDLNGELYPYDVDRLYALINDDKDFVLIQYFVFDKVLQPLSFYRLPE